MFQEVIFQRATNRRNGNEGGIAKAERVERRVQLGFIDYHPQHFAGLAEICAEGLQCAGISAFPYNLKFFLRLRYQIGDDTNAPQLALVHYCDSMAQCLRVREDVGGEEDGFTLIMKALDEITHLTTAHGIKARHWFIEKEDLR